MSDGSNPFILIARVTVKRGQVEAYLKIADTADKAVQGSESGMLFIILTLTQMTLTNLFGAKFIDVAVIF